MFGNSIGIILNCKECSIINDFKKIISIKIQSKRSKLEKIFTRPRNYKCSRPNRPRLILSEHNSLPFLRGQARPGQPLSLSEKKEKKVEKEKKKTFK